MNDLDLQRWLASQLTEEIALNFDQTQFFWRTQEHARRWTEITPREWLYVTSMVEAKLDYNQQVDYAISLWKLLDAHGWGEERGWWIMASATWQQRTRALMEVLK